MIRNVIFQNKFARNVQEVLLIWQGNFMENKDFFYKKEILHFKSEALFQSTGLCPQDPIVEDDTFEKELHHLQDLRQI